MADSLPKGIVASISTSNVSAIGAQPAILSNLALGNLIANVNLAQANAVSGQQTLNQLQATVLGKVVNRMIDAQPAEVAAQQAALTRDEVAMLRALLKLLKTL